MLPLPASTKQVSFCRSTFWSVSKGSEGTGPGGLEPRRPQDLRRHLGGYRQSAGPILSREPPQVFGAKRKTTVGLSQHDMEPQNGPGVSLLFQSLLSHAKRMATRVASTRQPDGFTKRCQPQNRTLFFASFRSTEQGPVQNVSPNESVP